jgi:hypothetical protein
MDFYRDKIGVYLVKSKHRKLKYFTIANGTKSFNKTTVA